MPAELHGKGCFFPTPWQPLFQKEVVNVFRKFFKLHFILILVFLFVFAMGGCSSSRQTLVILSGSENKELEPLIQKFEAQHHVKIEMQYQGSVDIMQTLQNGAEGYDAVWPANSIWISLGDTRKLGKHQKSIFSTPVVFGIRMGKAQELGFVGKDKISINDILGAITDRKLTFCMTSASQSNSGASAYIGFLYSLLGNPGMITLEDLQKPELKTKIQTLLAGVNRSSGSSEWLKELFLKGDYDAMVNYEALMISTNQALIKEGREPLYLLYPYDGLTFSDSPLCYLNHGDKDKEDLFLMFQEFMLSENIRKELAQLGRRTGLGGKILNADPKVFNPDWGINPTKVLSPIKMPSADVILEALNLYQTEFKKPSFTVFCIDFSGSMGGQGEALSKEAMDLLLDQTKAKKYFLQATSQDKIVIIPFDDSIMAVWEVTGNDAGLLGDLNEKIQAQSIRGGTDIYTPAIAALDLLKDVDTARYAPAVILMTDGASNTGKTFSDLKHIWDQNKKEIPIFSILFGNASEAQLEEIAELTRARVFDGKSDLISAFKKAKGYN